jgi:pre-mRNA-splicing factor 18
MDFLKAEIATKRKTLDSGNGNGTVNEAPPAKKYMRKADLDRIKRDEAKKAEQDRLQRAREERERKLFEGAKRVRAPRPHAHVVVAGG